jgi:hypothetical protein
VTSPSADGDLPAEVTLADGVAATDVRSERGGPPGKPASTDHGLSGASASTDHGPSGKPASTDHGLSGASASTDHGPSGKPASDDPDDADDADGEREEPDRADVVGERLAVPVLLAALAAIPATFLTLLDGPWAATGQALNLASGAVLVAETVVLFALSTDRRRWLRRNLWLVGLTLLLIPAVLFAVGPVQLLRLLRFVGALRVIRARRIVRAGKVVRERLGLERRWQVVASTGATVLAAAFVVLVLADPTSESRQAVDQVVDRVGVLGILVAGAILGAATFLTRQRR